MKKLQKLTLKEMQSSFLPSNVLSSHIKRTIVGGNDDADCFFEMLVSLYNRIPTGTCAYFDQGQWQALYVQWKDSIGGSGWNDVMNGVDCSDGLSFLCQYYNVSTTDFSQSNGGTKIGFLTTGPSTGHAVIINHIIESTSLVEYYDPNTGFCNIAYTWEFNSIYEVSCP